MARDETIFVRADKGETKTMDELARYIAKGNRSDALRTSAEITLWLYLNKPDVYHEAERTIAENDTQLAVA